MRLVDERRGHRPSRFRLSPSSRAGAAYRSSSGSVGGLDLGVALAPERVERFLVRGPAPFQQLPKTRSTSSASRSETRRRQRDHGGPLPLGVEGRTTSSVSSISRIHPLAAPRHGPPSLRRLESGARAGDRTRPNAPCRSRGSRGIELRGHDASSASAVRRPSCGAIGCKAATTLRMWSSSSSPSPSAPA